MIEDARLIEREAGDGFAVICDRHLSTCAHGVEVSAEVVSSVHDAMNPKRSATSRSRRRDVGVATCGACANAAA